MDTNLTIGVVFAGMCAVALCMEIFEWLRPYLGARTVATVETIGERAAVIVGGLVVVLLVGWFVVWQAVSTFTSVGDFLSTAVKMLGLYIASQFVLEIVADRVAAKVAARIRNGG